MQTARGKAAATACACGVGLGIVLALFVTGCGGGGDTSSTPVAADAGQPSTSAPSADDNSASFSPKPHHDSGGGTQQFETKGGDNSIQEAGSEASPSETDLAAAALHTYLDARAAGAWRTACGVLVSPVAESIARLGSEEKGSGGQAERGSCAALMASLSGGISPAALREAARADVGALRMVGDSGYVLFHGAEGDYFMPMAKEGGVWRVAALAASPLGSP